MKLTATFYKLYKQIVVHFILLKE